MDRHPDRASVATKHLKMKINGLGGHFQKQRRRVADTNELHYWYVTALITAAIVLSAFIQIYRQYCCL